MRELPGQHRGLVTPLLLAAGFGLIVSGWWVSSISHSARSDVILLAVGLALHGLAVGMWVSRAAKRRGVVAAIGVIECVAALYWLIAAPVAPGAAPAPGEAVAGLTSYASLGLLGAGLLLLVAVAHGRRVSGSNQLD